MNWIVKHYDELKNYELYEILHLRNEVFIVEQNCPYQDLDHKDDKCWHLMGWEENKLVAYTRLVPPGVSFAEPSIGRVVTSPSVRRSGIGKVLMDHSIKGAHKLFGKQPIRIGAQCYLIKFYESLGFEISGEEYLEDNIPHIEMVYGVGKEERI